MSKFVASFESVLPFLKYNANSVIFDNLIFKFHYRWTFIALLVSTILVTSRQYIGEHIRCISATIPEHVINTFCFFTPTFTVVRHLNNTALAKGHIFEPGIGPYEVSEEPIRIHAYYQWVPFVLFGQAICFYLPHMLWKVWEGGRIKSLVVGLRMVGLTQYLKENSKAIGTLDVPSLQEAESRVRDIRRTLIDNMRLNQAWGAHLVTAELLNLANLILQIVWTNQFLGGSFYVLGIRIMHENWSEKMDFLDMVFPKVTKCHFFKFGASGSLQMHDTLCVMALNIINEKIYSILWFWYFFLLIATGLGLVMRLLTLILYKNTFFTRHAFSWAKSGKLDDKELAAVVSKCNFSNWMFLYFLRSNMSDFLFKKVIYHLASEFPDPQRDNLRNAQLAHSQAHEQQQQQQQQQLQQQQLMYQPSTSGMSTLRLDDVDTPLMTEKQKLK